jgi:hypothetical protein
MNGDQSGSITSGAAGESASAPISAASLARLLPAIGEEQDRTDRAVLKVTNDPGAIRVCRQLQRRLDELAYRYDAVRALILQTEPLTADDALAVLGRVADDLNLMAGSDLPTDPCEFERRARRLQMAVERSVAVLADALVIELRALGVEFIVEVRP